MHALRPYTLCPTLLHQRTHVFQEEHGRLATVKVRPHAAGWTEQFGDYVTFQLTYVITTWSHAFGLPCEIASGLDIPWDGNTKRLAACALQDAIPQPV